MQDKDLNQEVQKTSPIMRKPDVDVLEESLRERLDDFASGVLPFFEKAANESFMVLEDQIEQRIRELHRYLNDLRAVNFLKENDFILE